MAGYLPANIFQHENAAIIRVREEPQCFTSKWYFSREELDHSPSRRDGIDQEAESRYRKLYCSYLQELGMELQVPQLTIATAMMYCHRFYTRQSLAKNCWQTVATACMYLGCKAEETSRSVNNITIVAYKLIYKWDPSAPRRIKQKEVHDKQKELILTGEKFILVTLAFDLNVELPYRPLVTAIKRLELSHQELIKISWNFVNDWLRTTLCLQYKPHYVAAGSLFLAAKFLNVRLPKGNGKGWWTQFGVAPKSLEDVVQQMVGLLEQNWKQARPPHKEEIAPSRIVKVVSSRMSQTGNQSGSAVQQDSGTLTSLAKTEVLNGSVSSKFYENRTCNNNVQETLNPEHLNGEGLNGSILFRCKGKQVCSDVQGRMKEPIPNCHASNSGSAESIVEDCKSEPLTGKTELDLSYKMVSVEGGGAQLDVNRIKEVLRKRKHERMTSRNLVEENGDDMDAEAWIERELENGIKLESSNADK